MTAFRSAPATQGKTLADARGDVFRGLEVVESVCNIGNNLMGETQENLSRGLDTYTYRQPLGVTAGICPFNFPAMIPLWMFPVSTACGNTMVMKPSEKDPGAAMILAKLAQEAGLPDGVVQVRSLPCSAPVAQRNGFVPNFQRLRRQQAKFHPKHAGGIPSLPLTVLTSARLHTHVFRSCTAAWTR
jgi:hypothetical protein